MTTLEMLTAQVRATALEQGRAEGRTEGQAALLLKQLGLRFGAVPDVIQSRITHASTEELEQWAEQVLRASSLEELLAP